MNDEKKLFEFVAKLEVRACFFVVMRDFIVLIEIMIDRAIDCSRAIRIVRSRDWDGHDELVGLHTA